MITALVLLPGGSGGNPHTSGNFHISGTSVTAGAPWRLQIENDGYGNGCTITLTDVHSGTQILREESLYSLSVFQINKTGTFRWYVNDRRCHATALEGPGAYKLPFPWSQHGAGDTPAFTASGPVAVRVTAWNGDSGCILTLKNATDGQPLESRTATPHNNPVTLNPGSSRSVYLSISNCDVIVSTAH